MKPVQRPEVNGTCWHACTCTGASQCGYDSSTCAAFTCNQGQRVAADGQRCVVDECAEVCLLCGTLFCFVHACGRDRLAVMMMRCTCSLHSHAHTTYMQSPLLGNVGRAWGARCVPPRLQLRPRPRLHAGRLSTGQPAVCGWVGRGGRGGGEAPRCVRQHCTHGGVEVGDHVLSCVEVC